MTVKEAFILSGSGAAMVLVVAWMRYGPWHLGRRVHALWASLGSRGEVADVPDPVDAQLDTNPRELTLDEVADLIRAAAPPADGYKARIRARIARDNRAAEESQLLREIYAAQSLARDGVDVERGAPKEMTP